MAKNFTRLTKLIQYQPNESSCALLNKRKLHVILGYISSVCYGNKLLQSLSEAFFPQQIGGFKMAAFWSFFTFSSTLKQHNLQINSRRCSVDPSYLDLGILFLVDTTT